MKPASTGRFRGFTASERNSLLSRHSKTERTAFDEGNCYEIASKGQAADNPLIMLATQTFVLLVIDRVSEIAILPVMFGWPAVVAAIALMSVGIARMRADFVLGGALLAIPFLFYLFLSSRFQWVVFPVGTLLFGASGAVSRGHRRAALAMAAPFVALALFVAWFVVRQWIG